MRREDDLKMARRRCRLCRRLCWRRNKVFAVAVSSSTSAAKAAPDGRRAGKEEPDPDAARPRQAQRRGDFAPRGNEAEAGGVRRGLPRKRRWGRKSRRRKARDAAEVLPEPVGNHVGDLVDDDDGQGVVVGEPLEPDGDGEERGGARGVELPAAGAASEGLLSSGCPPRCSCSVRCCCGGLRGGGGVPEERG